MRIAKKTRTHWARLAVDYYRDPKFIAAGPIAELAFVRLLALARERVETAEISGSVPYLLAARELREVTDLWAGSHGGGFDDLVGALVANDLAYLDGDQIVLTGYDEWQTTREDIERNRQDSRARQQASRARRGGEDPEAGPPQPPPAQGSRGAPDGSGTREGKSNKTRSKTKKASAEADKEDDMGVYDKPVEPFTDLRESGTVKSGGRKVGKHGLDPKQVAAAEKIVEHLTKVRKEVLGGAFRVTEAWWTDVRKMLNGSADAPRMTAEQVCDLIDFALNDRFWHAHCQTPAGLAKHSAKIFNSDEFVAWSKASGKPKENRPRDTLIRDNGKPTFKGGLAADQKVDWSKESENW